MGQLWLLSCQVSTKPVSDARAPRGLYWFIWCENNIDSLEEQPGSFLLTDCLFQDKSRRGRVRKCFSIEEALITTKYLSYCQVSWCQVSVVINIHYDRNSKNPSFHLVINVPIWSISSLYLCSLQGCRLPLTLRHTQTHTLRLTHTFQNTP